VHIDEYAEADQCDSEEARCIEAPCQHPEQQCHSKKTDEIIYHEKQLEDSMASPQDMLDEQNQYLYHVAGEKMDSYNSFEENYLNAIDSCYILKKQVGY
jgi:hypothetical protein